MEAGRLQSELALKIPILLTLPRSRQRESGVREAKLLRYPGMQFCLSRHRTKTSQEHEPA
jgi:hypothetical protein